ncbi:MAG: tRNA epoxyqueuosine(34) reductase QueG [Elusimicrobia bacterium]|nr:tRNA epoxyqueuosine(34) reductase QueG [Elusimicrobiota bacterium]
MTSVSKESVRRSADELGIDLLGFTSALPLENARRRMEECLTRGLIPPGSDWKPEGIAAFCDPRRVLPSAASVICAAQCYLSEVEPDDLSKPGEPHGLIARYTRRNHYRDLHARLAGLEKIIGELAGRRVASKSFCCGPLAEKPLARNAGLGWYGKHGIIVTPAFGSWVVLAEIVTELEFEPDPELRDGCGDCSLCLRACPTGALIAPALLDRAKCIQHLTNSPAPVPLKFRELWGRRLYGCTACQEACPKNRAVKPLNRRLSCGSVGPSLPLIPLLSMTEAEYRIKYADNQVSAGWIRFESIQRNACLALGNSGDPAAIGPLSEVMSSNPSLLVRSHAAWALGRIGGKAGVLALERALACESKAQVRAELESARKTAGHC